jgi:ubiquinone/menaquinone biosynthesis C-methylase UbiE
MDNEPLRSFLRLNLEREALEYYGLTDDDWLDSITEAWLDDRGNSQWRFAEIEQFSGVSLTKEKRILDMACGCGTFIYYGLLNGMDVWGIDPEDWKHQFNRAKCDKYGYPIEWKSRFIKGVGENLPFPNSYFDFVASYQTLEHVQNVEKCLSEMVRVLKPGGVIFLQAPDYTGTYEGHYRLPWLPLFPKQIARIYLKALKRPSKGLTAINYVTSRNIKQLFSRFYYVEGIIDQEKERFTHEWAKRFHISIPLLQNGLFSLWKLVTRIRVIFRHESSIDLRIVKRRNV